MPYIIRRINIKEVGEMKDNVLLKTSIFGMIGLGALSTIIFLTQMSTAMQYLDVLGAFGGGFGFVKFLLYLNLILRAALLGFGIYAFMAMQKGQLDFKILGMACILFIADLVFTVLMLISMMHTIDIFILLSAGSLALFVYALKKAGLGV